MQQVKKLFKDYGSRIELVNQIILKFANGKSPLIKEISNHLIQSGGKRIRPTLLLMASDLCRQESNEAILNLAAAVEMIHSATLLHDDVVDNSMMRRSQKTANAIWDNKASILVGDYVFSVAFQLMVKSNSLKALELLAKTSSIMADGEVMQLEHSKNIDISLKTYLDIIFGKTAILFSSACCVPAIIAQKSEQEILALQEFGKNLGIIFQMVDDVLDYSSSNDIFGKEIGDDFFEGKITLPLIKLYQKASQEDKVIIKNIHQENLMAKKDSIKFEKILELIGKYAIIQDCKSVITDYQKSAIRNLEIFENCPEKEKMLTILDYSLSRIS